MNRAKIFIAFISLLLFVICGAAQTIKSTKGLDNLDLMNVNRQTKNSGAGIVTPNELEGFEFFKTGKLNNIRIGISTESDVQNIFGSSCEKPCDYDSNWIITVVYFDESDILIENKYDQKSNKTIETHYIPKKEVIGKIVSVEVRPKKRTSFENVNFSGNLKKFSHLENGYLTPSISKDGVLIDIYADSYGLQYLIFDKFTSDNFKDTFNLRKRFSNFSKGDLITIKYMIPEELESNFYVEDN